MAQDKDEAMKDKTKCVINFDLEKVLTTPRADVGPMYYLSKLCVWNFTIYELAEHVGHCFVWNETQGSRGSAEISSFLLNFFREKSETMVKNFVLYSDSCSGQNKNQNIFTMYLKAANELNVTITHRFIDIKLISSYCMNMPELWKFIFQSIFQPFNTFRATSPIYGSNAHAFKMGPKFRRTERVNVKNRVTFCPWQRSTKPQNPLGTTWV